MVVDADLQSVDFKFFVCLECRMNYSLHPLEWKHYQQSRSLVETIFSIYEMPTFKKAWRERSEAHSFGVFSEGTLIALGLVDIFNKIQYICVDTLFQSAGLGSILIKKILFSLSDERSIWLTSAGDERLLKWYGRYGFQVVKMFKDCKGKFTGADMVRRQRCRSEKVLALASGG
jgi:ribosomal protein S18 acetylase RimI-like enzyme